MRTPLARRLAMDLPLGLALAAVPFLWRAASGVLEVLGHYQTVTGLGIEASTFALAFLALDGALGFAGAGAGLVAAAIELGARRGRTLIMGRAFAFLICGVAAAVALRFALPHRFGVLAFQLGFGAAMALAAAAFLATRLKDYVQSRAPAAGLGRLEKAGAR